MRNRAVNTLTSGILNPKHIANIFFIHNKIYKKVGNLNVEGVLSDEPISADNIKNEKFVPMRKKQGWAKIFGCGWFHITGKIPNDLKRENVVLKIMLEGEGLVYDNNFNILQGVSKVASAVSFFNSFFGKQIVELPKVSIESVNSAKDNSTTNNDYEITLTNNENVDIYIDSGFNGSSSKNKIAKIKKIEICVKDDAVKKYYYDYFELYNLLLCLDRKKDYKRLKEINKGLRKSYSVFKKEGAVKASEFLESILHKPIDYDAVEYTAIGHAHLDLAWLWPIRETKRKAGRTIANQLKNIEKYDDYVFGISQPQMLVWLKEEYPSLFEKVKEQVKLGRIELQGGMWVESDCNLTSGESLIRQCLYGKKYFKENFDEDVRVCWLPDVFGYTAALPQILKKCGMDYFFSVKLSSNWVNEFPYKSFNWAGIDGTSVLAHFAPAGNYSVGTTPFSIFQSNRRNSEKNIVDKALLVFGDGDGGGGPGEIHLENVNRMIKGVNGLNPVKMDKAVNFFDNIKHLQNVIPSHKGELYFERHQGTYTSQALVKKYNRNTEELLHYIEWLISEAYLKNISYDKKTLERLWKEVLLYQFHDILPGSSIKRVYDECHEGYKKITKELEEILNELLLKLKTKDKLTAINNTPFYRNELIKHKNSWYKADIMPYSSSSLLPFNLENINLLIENNKMENNILKLTFNEEGEIISIYDKINKFELVKDYFNRLTVYSDPPVHYNAWDIPMNYESLKKSTFKLISSENINDGARIIKRNTYKYNNSTLTQDVILYSDDDLIYFETNVDWDEKYKLLRADFTPRVFAEQVKCDIQFGSINRSTKNETSEEKAQFEICAHKYINIDGDGYGFAILNDCKFGHKAKEGFVSLALLRSPKWPDPTCDIGKHSFTYAIYPHKQKAENSNVISKGYALNNKLEIVNFDINVKTIAIISNPKIILETIKVAENNKGLILRLYESVGINNTTNIKLKQDAKNIYECDMLENIINAVSLDNVSFTPFEVKTLYVEFDY